MTAKKKVATEEVKAAKVEEPEAEAPEAPVEDDGIRRDPASGAIITGEDEHGNALSTDDVAGGAVPIASPVERLEAEAEGDAE